MKVCLITKCVVRVGHGGSWYAFEVSMARAETRWGMRMVPSGRGPWTMGTWEASAERYNLIGYSYREPCARSMMIRIAMSCDYVSALPIVLLVLPITSSLCLLPWCMVVLRCEGGEARSCTLFIVLRRLRRDVATLKTMSSIVPAPWRRPRSEPKQRCRCGNRRAPGAPPAAAPVRPRIV